MYDSRERNQYCY